MKRLAIAPGIIYSANLNAAHPTTEEVKTDVVETSTSGTPLTSRRVLPLPKKQAHGDSKQMNGSATKL